MQPIVDFHCDLLLHLGINPQRTASDLSARCAIPQLRKGGVKLQILAVFTETGPQSVEKGQRQIDLYQKLPVHYPKDFQHFSNDWTLQSPRINVCMAFENASGFCDEHEPLQQGFNRLKKISKPLYISLTWNGENRFGGGVFSPKGLKEDGKHLLKELDGQNIALDLSHASDPLAYEAIDFIEGNHLSIPIMASHSNARAVTSVPRNLPDDIAKEIFRKRGIIGINLFRPFVGETHEYFLKHLAHWLELGGENSIAFGADFFNIVDLPASSAAKYGKELFFQDYPDSSCYPALLSFLQKEFGPSLIDKLSHQNALSFIKKSYA